MSPTVIEQRAIRTVSPVSAAPTRGVIFLSHATPQENPFVVWLTAQLVSAGYEVWCDVTKLLGGERFWKDIEEAIDKHTFRFLFVSTHLTNQKPGTLRELKLALEAQARHDIKDFVVPLKIDEFPFQAMDERIRDLNFMRFDEGWPTALARLLKLLDREGAPKSSLATPECVTAWFNRSLDCRRKSQVGDEKAYSNWFRFRLPKHVKFHRLDGNEKRVAALSEGLPYPHRVVGCGLLTFALEAEVSETVFGSARVVETVDLLTDAFIREGSPDLAILPFDASNMVTDIVAQAWERTLTQKGLGRFELGSGLSARFFNKDALEKNRAYFIKAGRRTFRQLVGAKSKRTLEGGKAPDGFWHYAVSASPQLHPFPRIILRHHVIFTDDGVKPWASADRMQKARRSVCKQWWNAEWRDRLFAMCAELGGGEDVLSLPVAEHVGIELSMTGMSFTSPRRFFEDNQVGLNEASEIELIEDADEEEADVIGV